MQIEFYGATSGVTGSCHILRANEHTILLDCGMIQGRRKEMERNRRPFPFSPDEISAVVLSHGHIDHSGRIPLLVKQGYDGPLYAHNATCDLCRILLKDSASLQQRDAEYENKWRKRKGKPLVVAEGYMDVIALSEAGFTATVAPLGTASTEDQLRLLWRMAP